MAANMMGKAKDNGRSAGEQRRPRRELLAGAAAVLGVVTVETLANAGPAHAAQGSAVILGQDNMGATASTGVFDTGGESAVLADPATHTGVAGTGGGNGPGVRGQGAGFGSGVLGFGGANDGTGVTGTADGNGTGVIGNGHGFGSGVVGNGGGGGDAHGVEGFGSGTGSGLVGRGAPAAVQASSALPWATAPGWSALVPGLAPAWRASAAPGASACWRKAAREEPR